MPDESSAPIYVNVTGQRCPPNTWRKGWPQKLVAENSQEFWRLRDGKPLPSGSGGDDVLYGRIVRFDKDEDMPIISTEAQYMIDPNTLNTSRLLFIKTIWATDDQLGGTLEDTFLTEYPDQAAPAK
jgi:hypothetical protein